MSAVAVPIPFTLKRGASGRWFIQHGAVAHLAWTGARWARHDRGLPAAGSQICNFRTEGEARAYALQAGLGREVS